MRTAVVGAARELQTAPCRIAARVPESHIARQAVGQFITCKGRAVDDIAEYCSAEVGGSAESGIAEVANECGAADGQGGGCERTVVGQSAAARCDPSAARDVERTARGVSEHGAVEGQRSARLSDRARVGSGRGIERQIASPAQLQTSTINEGVPCNGERPCVLRKRSVICEAAGLAGLASNGRARIRQIDCTTAAVGKRRVRQRQRAAGLTDRACVGTNRSVNRQAAPAAQLQASAVGESAVGDGEISPGLSDRSGVGRGRAAERQSAAAAALKSAAVGEHVGINVQTVAIACGDGAGVGEVADPPVVRPAKRGGLSGDIGIDRSRRSEGGGVVAASAVGIADACNIARERQSIAEGVSRVRTAVVGAARELQTAACRIAARVPESHIADKGGRRA